MYHLSKKDKAVMASKRLHWKQKNWKKQHQQTDKPPKKAVYNDIIITDDSGKVKEIHEFSKAKFGIFSKRGYRAYSIHLTKEEAQKAFEAKGFSPNLCEIREIIEWGEEDEN